MAKGTGMIKRGISTKRASDAMQIESTVGTDMDVCPNCGKFYNPKTAKGKCPYCKVSF